MYDKAVDKGLEGVKVCSTSLSVIEESCLYFRGYKLEDLAEHSRFSEVMYLLLKGKLPTARELSSWEDNISRRLVLDPEIPLASLPTKNAHPMAWLRTAVSLVGLKEEQGRAFFQDSQALENAGLSLIAQTPLLISFFHRQRQNLQPLEPERDKSLAWNFLYALHGEEPSEEEAGILDKCLILHADHGLNCSTFSARVASSALSDLYSAIVSAIGALKGILHGGANEKVMRMLSQLSSKKEAENFVDTALAKKEKIMGFGHRVYKARDPRAVILKSMSQKLTQSKGKKALFLISEAIERKVKEVKGLCANVDFYSASVYHCLGIPADLFTAVFAMSRMAGWLAHIKEQYLNNRIYRPASLWKGDKNKKWKPIGQRS